MGSIISPARPGILYIRNLKNLKNYGSPTLRTLRFGRVNSKFGSFSTFSHRILGRFTTFFPIPRQCESNKIKQMFDIFSLLTLFMKIILRLRNNLFLENNGKSMAKQWQLFFLESEVFCEIVEVVVFIDLFLFK